MSPGANRGGGGLRRSRRRNRTLKLFLKIISGRAGRVLSAVVAFRNGRFAGRTCKGLYLHEHTYETRRARPGYAQDRGTFASGWKGRETAGTVCGGPGRRRGDRRRGGRSEEPTAPG